MGLKQLVAAAVKTAMTAAGDVVEAIEYHRVVPGSYSPQTDSVNAVDTTYNIPGLPLALAENEYDWAKNNDVHKKFIFDVAQFTALGFEPGQTDYIIYDGARYENKLLKTSVAKALVTIYGQQV